MITCSKQNWILLLSIWNRFSFIHSSKTCSNEDSKTIHWGSMYPLYMFDVLQAREMKFLWVTIKLTQENNSCSHGLGATIKYIYSVLFWLWGIDTESDFFNASDWSLVTNSAISLVEIDYMLHRFSSFLIFHTSELFYLAFCAYWNCSNRIK